MTRLAIDLTTDAFGEAFTATMRDYGVPIQTVTFGDVHGYPYLRLQFAGEPGPDGPPDPAEVGAFIGECAATAEAALAQKLWRDVMRRWDTEIKPAAVAAHAELFAVDLAALDDAGLADHLDRCIEHSRAMVRQHHRFNTSALLPVADFTLQAAPWTGRSPESLLGLFEGSSPISGVWSSEIEPAAKAVIADDGAMALLDPSGGEPAARLATLRARLPEVDRWVAAVGMRLVDGFDLVGTTLIEAPALLLGKLAAAVALGGPPDRSGVAALESEIRTTVPAEHRGAFDELLADARLVYRLRDERGVYSDMSATGLTRLAVLELGRRLVGSGRIDAAEHAFELRVDELRAVSRGDGGPSAAELRARASARAVAATATAPPFLGPPPGPPPPPEMLPPALGRVVGAIGYAIHTVLDEMPEPSSAGGVIRGLAGSAGVVEGRARVITDIAQLVTLEPGDILVSATTSEAFNCAVHLVGAIVTDHGGVASHAAIVSREVGIPAVVGTGTASTTIPDGARVRVDGAKGEVTLLS
jgi:pyruvate,water dikinase